MFTYNPIPKEFTGQLEEVYWTSGARLSEALNKARPDLPRYTGPQLELAPLAYDAVWPDARASKQIIVLDCEVLQSNPAISADVAESCATHCPEAMRMAYGAGGGPWARIEDFIAASDKEVDRVFAGWKRFFDLMDYILVGVNLIGAPYVDRDLASAAKVSATMRRHYPTKPQVFSVFGAYNWDPYPPLTPDVYPKIANLVQQNHGQTIVWQPTVGRDEGLLKALWAGRAPTTGTVN